MYGVGMIIVCCNFEAEKPGATNMADIKRIEREDDPERCLGMLMGDQCYNKSVPGTKYCAIHGGVQAEQRLVKQGYKNYQLKKFQAKLDRMSDSSAIKSLKEEVGILRMILEERLNQITDETDLVLNSQFIADMVMKIEKVVSSMTKLDMQLGQMLDKQALLQMAAGLSTIITEELKDPILVETVINKIGDLITATFVDKDLDDDDEA